MALAHHHCARGGGRRRKRVHKPCHAAPDAPCAHHGPQHRLTVPHRCVRLHGSCGRPHARRRWLPRAPRAAPARMAADGPWSWACTHGRAEAPWAARRRAGRAHGPEPARERQVERPQGAGRVRERTASPPVLSLPVVPGPRRSVGSATSACLVLALIESSCHTMPHRAFAALTGVLDATVERTVPKKRPETCRKKPL